LDFLLIDCTLSSWADLASALMSCHWDIGDRPLVLGEASLTHGAAPKTPDIPWIIDTAVGCGVGGTVLREFSRTEPSTPGVLDARITRRTVRDLDVEWPSISVVINAYNAEATLDECLYHCDRLEYPKLEVIVVDDGSTDATAAIAGARPRAELVTIPHSGLSVGRNVGYRSAHGELVVYLDADAYPSPDWPWYLALGALGDRVGGSGGPNVPPPDDPASARIVARSPGGPVPQLRGPDRAEHVPGCNMAFWRSVLEQLHGFDPVIEGAEDIEFEWRVVESGHELAYHPAALVWHHRRPGLRHYLRQQCQYGRGQAILERRDPERFPAGYRVRKAAVRLHPRRHDTATTAFYPVRYLTLLRQDGPSLELAHQWGMPVAIVVCFTAPLALVRRKLGAPAGVATGFIGTLFAIDLLLAGHDRRRSQRKLGFRAGVATFRLLRPLAFRWGHLRGRRESLRNSSAWPPVSAPASAESEGATEV
jgi:hypothetical protein